MSIAGGWGAYRIYAPVLERSSRASRTLSALPSMAAGRAGGRGTRRNVNSGVSVVNNAVFRGKYAVSVCVNGLQWVSSTPNFRTLRAEIAAKVTLTHEKEGSDGTRRHY